MKAVLNWKCLIAYALLCIGLVCLLAIFADDERPLGEWLAIRACLAMVSAASFYAMHRLTPISELNDENH